MYAPSRGEQGRVRVPVRPGERAFLELRISGAVKNPSLAAADGRVWAFPVELGGEDRLFCRDGVCWYVLRPKSMDAFDIVAKGRLADPLPVLERSAEFTASSSDPASAAAQIDIVKRYSDGGEHPNRGRRYTFGQGDGGAGGDTDGLLNSNWSAAK